MFAIAVTPGDRLGLGDYKFKSTKLTELRPVLPNQVTAGDQFTAGFSVLNRSDKTRTIDVNLQANGPIDAGAAQVHQVLTLGPFKRDTVWLPVTTIGHGNIKFMAKASATSVCRSMSLPAMARRWSRELTKRCNFRLG